MSAGHSNIILSLKGIISNMEAVEKISSIYRNRFHYPLKLDTKNVCQGSLAREGSRLAWL